MGWGAVHSTGRTPRLSESRNYGLASGVTSGHDSVGGTAPAGPHAHQGPDRSGAAGFVPAHTDPVAWDPDVYEAFRSPRLRPGLDLLARVPTEPARIVDLGCGTGTLTAYLRQRWPEADITGVDQSDAMLARARDALADVTWVQADASAWSPDPPPDLVFTNAALHWMPDHATLFPRLVGWLAPGGTLAVQMPRNFAFPSHRLVSEVLDAGNFGTEALRARMRRVPVATPEDYYSWCAPVAATVDVWETTYLHVLEGDDPVLRWIWGATLRPVIQALDAAETDRFRARLSIVLRGAYPRRDDGTTLFPFRRIFVLVRT